MVAAVPRLAVAQDPGGNARAGVVTGTVIAAGSLRPLQGAQIQVAGTPAGTMTDANGRFRLSQLSGTSVSVVVRLIGYAPRTTTLRVGDADARVELTEAVTTLDQVVITGTPGATQVRAVGNAVSQVSAAEVVQVAPVSDVQQLLNARVPGLTILPASGNVGTGGSVRVRGVASLSLSNEPILYIDGVRANNAPDAGPNIRQGRQANRLNDINPEDIESIEVIKGPAAATLYGTEASSGVIQIITKKGRAGLPAWDFAIKQGANWLMDVGGKVPTVYSRDAAGVISGVNLYTNEKAAGRDPFQTGRSQSYLGSLRGGTDLIRYFISGEWDNSAGIVSYNWQHKYTTRANLSVVPNSKITVNGNLGFTRSNTRFGQSASGWDLWGNIVWGSPSRLTTPTRGFLRVTPEAAGEIETYAGVDRVTGSLQLQYSPYSWLANRFTVGTDVGDETNSILFPRNPAGSSYFFGALSLGQKTVERVRTGYNTVDYAATGTFELPGRLSSWTSATSGGLQYYAKRLESVSAVGQQFPSPSVTTIGGAAVTTSVEDIIENKTAGFYVQEQVSRANRLFITAAVRADNNSAFGENFNAAIYPKLSGSWVVSEEPFWKMPAFNSLKLRAAYGLAGKQPDVFAARRLYQPATGPGNISVLTPQAIGNPDLKPEVGQELEVGFDAGLFNDLIGVNLTYFRQRTQDAIVMRQVSPSIGFPGFQFVNVGEVSNRGVELASDIRLLERPSLAWRAGLSYATNANKVVSLGGLPPIVLGSGQENREGYPIGAFFAKKVLSADLVAGRAQNVMCEGGDGSAVPCASAPRVYWGTPTPTWQGALNTSLTLWSNLRLYGLVDFRGGHMTSYGDVQAMHTTFRNSLAINQGTDPILMAYDQLGLTDQTGYFDAGFAKLREVSATYTLTPQLARRVGAASASINVAGRNLATLWVAQKEIYGQPVPDPEVRTPAAGLSAYVQTVVPPLSQFIMTVRLSY
jgi:TonB-linked SusC/RagA family outer membrane protein